MAGLSRLYDFTANNTIQSTQVDAEFNQIVDVLNSATTGLNKDHVDPTGEIMLNDTATTVSATHTYTTKPDFSADPLIAADVDETVVATRAGTTAFSGKQTFDAGIDANGGIENGIFENVGALPAAVAGDKGRIVFLTTDNKLYGCDGTAYVDLMQVTGAYAGSPRSYSDDLTIDNNNSKVMLVKIDATSTAANLYIKGALYPTNFYTSLGVHSHGATGLTASSPVTDGGHTHSTDIGSHTHTGSFGTDSHTHTGGNHNHSISLTTNTTSAHNHTGTTGTAGPGIVDGFTHYHTISDSGSHAHTVSGNSSNESSGASSVPSATASVGSATIGSKTSASSVTGVTVATTISGSTANAGVNGGTIDSAVKTYVDSMQVWIDGVDRTATILAATGWAAIGDGTAGHLFVTSGSGEVDVYSHMSGVGMHTIEFKEPTSAKGGRVLYHMEVS